MSWTSNFLLVIGKVYIAERLVNLWTISSDEEVLLAMGFLGEPDLECSLDEYEIFLICLFREGVFLLEDEADAELLQIKARIENDL